MEKYRYTLRYFSHYFLLKTTFIGSPLLTSARPNLISLLFKVPIARLINVANISRYVLHDVRVHCHYRRAHERVRDAHASSRASGRRKYVNLYFIGHPRPRAHVCGRTRAPGPGIIHSRVCTYKHSIYI